MNIRASITSAMVASLIGLPAAASPNDPKPARQLVLQIHRVECINETGVPKIGRDEISLSGLTIDAAGRAVRVKTLPVGKFEGAGSRKSYSPPHVFASFDLRTGPAFPNRYRAVLVLAERDNGGGLTKFVEAIVQRTNKAPTPSSPSKGTSLPDLSGDPKEIALQAGIEFATAKFEKWMKDDIFPPHRDNLVIPSPTFRFEGGAMKGPVETATLTAHKGKYRITYSWRLIG